MAQREHLFDIMTMMLLDHHKWLVTLENLIKM